ncbi:MAG: hypothetical protein ACTHNG_16780 [Ginsengibacter sp.]
MKFLYYFKYFYFIARNWNAKLAAFTVYHEIKGEKKYNLDTVRINRLNNENIESENLVHASIYQASSYYLIEKAFSFFENEIKDGAFVDFGCGKGRVLIMAAHFGFKKINGIEFSQKLCVDAEANVDQVEALFANTVFKILNEDAAGYRIENDQNFFFFFNPFDEVVMLEVVKNILLSLKQNPRKIFVIYINPVHIEIFLSAGFDEEWHFRKMEYLEFSILSKDVEDF